MAHSRPTSVRTPDPLQTFLLACADVRSESKSGGHHIRVCRPADATAEVASRSGMRRHASRHPSIGTSLPYTALPTRWPMPAVTAIAAAPQKATRAVARGMAAPPALAPSAPSTARNTSEAADTE